MGMLEVGADSDKKNTRSFAHLYSFLGYLERALFCKFLCVINFLSILKLTNTIQSMMH